VDGRGDTGHRRGGHPEAPADRTSNIQDEFFNRARREGTAVTIFLTNGKKLSGRIRSFDKFTVIVEMNRVEQMIFKHAISTVSLGKPWQGGARPPGDPSHAAPPEPAEGEASEDAEVEPSGDTGDPSTP
jgi:host factor-I protein